MNSRVNKSNLIFWIGIVVIASDGYSFASNYVSMLADWMGHFLFLVVLPVAVLIHLNRSQGIALKDIGLGGGASIASTCLDGFWITLLWFAVAVMVSAFCEHYVVRQMPGLDYVYYTKGLLPESGIGRIVGAMYLSFVYGLIEEIVYRGLPRLLFDGAMSKKSSMLYIVMSAAIFAHAHWAQGGVSIIVNFFVGLMAGAMYLQLRTLRPLIIAHVSYDFLVLSGWL